MESSSQRHQAALFHSSSTYTHNRTECASGCPRVHSPGPLYHEQIQSARKRPCWTPHRSTVCVGVVVMGVGWWRWCRVVWGGGGHQSWRPVQIRDPAESSGAAAAQVSPSDPISARSSPSAPTGSKSEPCSPAPCPSAPAALDHGNVRGELKGVFCEAGAEVARETLSLLLQFPNGYHVHMQADPQLSSCAPCP